MLHNSHINVAIAHIWMRPISLYDLQEPEYKNLGSEIEKQKLYPYDFGPRWNQKNDKRSKMCDLWLAYSGPSLIWAEIRRYFVWSQIAKIIFSIGRMLLHDSYINVTTA